MANGNDQRPYYDDEDELQRRIQPVRQVEMRTPQPPPEETGYTAAQIPPMPERIAPVPQYGSSEQKRQEAAQLHEKIYNQLPEHQWRNLTAPQKIGRIAGIAGNVAGEVFVPGVMPTIPGTTTNRMMRMRRLEEEIPVAQREEVEAARERSEEPLREAQTGHLQAETLTAGGPQLIPGEEGVWRDTDTSGKTTASGHRYKDLRGKIFEVPDTQDPVDFILGHGGALGPNYRPSGRPTETLPSVGAAPSVAEAPTGTPGQIPAVPAAAPPPVAAPAPPQVTRVTGPEKQKVPTAEQQRKEDFFAAAQIPEDRRTPQQQLLFNELRGEYGKQLAITAADLKQKNDSMNADYERARAVLGNDAPKPNLIAPNDNYDTADKKQADYSEKLYRDLRMKNEADTRRGLQDLQAQMLQDKLEKERGDAAAQADQAWFGLYAQKNYQDHVHEWHKSGKFVKDSGLVTEQLGERGAGGPTLGPFAGLLASTPQGAIAAIGAESFLGFARNTLNGYLDTAKKAGISGPGYQAMSAYANAIVGRMQYELGAAGVRASALRMRDVMQKVLMTVPPPNTPPEQFDRAFDQYYKQMEMAVTRRKFGGVGKDYVKPSYESVFPSDTGTPGPGKRWNPVKGAYE